MTGSEFCLRLGPADGRVRVMFVPPLFEEANRMRRTLVMAMRALAANDIASLLPDLPGQNDSMIATADVTLAQWRRAVAENVAAEGAPVIIASVRSGALIDDTAVAAGWWRLAPVSGASLVRTMLRARVASDRERGVESNADGLLAEARNAPLLLAGNRLCPAMIAQLQVAQPAPCAPLRTVTLGGGTDQIDGSPLWLRAEPGEDAVLASAIAADITNWAATCARR